MNNHHSDQLPEEGVAPPSDEVTSDEVYEQPQNVPTQQSTAPIDEAMDSATGQEDAAVATEEESIKPANSVKKQNVTQHTEMFVPADEKTFGMNEVVSLPSAAADTTAAILASSDRQSTYNEDWLNGLREAQTLQHDAGEFTPALEDPKRNWSNVVKFQNLNMSAQRLRPPSRGENITGDRAVVYMSDHLGLGVPIRVPFWNSGIWVTLRTVYDPTILALMRTLTESRLNLGRSTYAVGFSSYMHHTVSEIFNVFQAHISNSTLTDNGDLADVLTITDIPTMMLAIASAIYPNGFDYTRSCVADIGKCQHITKGKLVLSRALQVDTSRLSEKQMRHMSKTANRTVTPEHAREYQSEMPASIKNSAIVTSTNGSRMKVTFRTPSLRSYFASGEDWLGMITSAANEALGMQASYDEKNRFMNNVAASINMQSISHWIESLEPLDPEGSATNDEQGIVITDREGIEKTCGNVISRDPGLSQDLMNALREYNNDITAAIVGISNYVCEACQKPQFTITDEEGNVVDTPAIIPIDAATTFFNLLRQRTQLITERA